MAMMSRTSIATPHIARLVALIKQKFPNFSSSTIGLVLYTTASFYDNNGDPIVAPCAYSYPDQNQLPATHPLTRAVAPSMQLLL
uniref:Peptidase S8/S53 domain-containing protein n=1 Tax=Nelumbo nucifera TaxID=4432 RepID=A0A822Y9T3_NELNU|nr:TPA_asm: hypothetical protein HUJ06_030624 [Nelumbo nucifera]